MESNIILVIFVHSVKIPFCLAKKSLFKPIQAENLGKKKLSKTLICKRNLIYLQKNKLLLYSVLKSVSNKNRDAGIEFNTFFFDHIHEVWTQLWYNIPKLGIFNNVVGLTKKLAILYQLDQTVATSNSLVCSKTCKCSNVWLNQRKFRNKLLLFKVFGIK